jgi:predicted metal-dependent hydrolase
LILKNTLHDSSVRTSTPHGDISYSLVRSKKRKTLCIHIDQKLHVRVLAPQGLTQGLIDSFIKKKSRWIQAKLSEFQQRSFSSERRSYAHGQSFLFLGRRYPLSYVPSDKKRVSVHWMNDHWQVLIPMDAFVHYVEDKVACALKRWYQCEAREVLASRVFSCARKLGVDPLGVAVRGQKKIWGSCHYREKKINLNWKMVMAPLEVIDYIIIHELCHLKAPDHSKKFWAFVKEACPRYRQCEQWLKDNGGLMIL